MFDSDQEVPRGWGWLLATAFVLLYLPNLGVMPLSRLEAIAAMGALDLVSAVGGDRPFATYPLYPQLVRFVRFAVGENEWAVRLPSVLAILGMTAASGLMARRVGGGASSQVAMLVVFSPILCLVAGRTATGHALSAFLLSTAWFVWYYLGRVKHRWSLAWALALTLVLVAAFHGGPRAFVVFYFPLFFLRRPLKVWRRLRMPQHLIFLGLALLIFVPWFHGQMKDAFLLPLESVLAEPGASLRNVFRFPFRAFALMLPAPFFFWPGFCAAFRPLEKDAELASFMRTLVLPLFLAFWLIPQAEPIDLLVLLPPLAVLAGMHYEILMRRYSRFLLRGFNFCERVLLAAVSALSVAWLLVALGLIEIERLPGLHAWSAVASGVALVLLLISLRRAGCLYLPVWLRLAAMVAVACLLVTVGWLPTRSIFLRMHNDRAAVLRRQVPAGATVYKLTPMPLPKESFYLKRKVVFVDFPAQLPDQPEAVWVLGGFNPPLTDRFTWTPASDLVDPEDDYAAEFDWWPGGRKILRVRVRRRPGDLPEALAGIRMYRGERRRDPGTSAAAE